MKSGRTADWTLEDLVAFEQALSAPPAATPELRAGVVEAARGLEGAAARRAGLKAWLDSTPAPHAAGRRFASALAVVGTGLAFVLFSSGVTAVLGLFDRGRGGVNVTLFLAVLIGGQWLLLIAAAIAWALRRRAAEGFSGVQALLGKLARRLAGGDPHGWEHLLDAGVHPRAAVLWRLARLVQAGGIAFNLGILAGLSGLVLLRHVGFFWETTTDQAMRSTLHQGVHLLSLPWAGWWPGAVPDLDLIDATRWLPGRSGALPPGPAGWWEFLLAAILFWGLLPRLALWLLAWRAGRHALGSLDFQGRRHRALWRELTSAGRTETDDKPLDGVLVLDVGGSGIDPDGLRPFLLRRLRVHPASWQSTAVLDSAAESATAAALAAAPAGVVLLAEGWALSPPRMAALHARIRTTAGPVIPVKFLIANASAAHQAASPSATERAEWTRFVDSLRDPAAEVFFFEAAQPGL